MGSKHAPRALSARLGFERARPHVTGPAASGLAMQDDARGVARPACAIEPYDRGSPPNETRPRSSPPAFEDGPSEHLTGDRFWVNAGVRLGDAWCVSIVEMAGDGFPHRHGQIGPCVGFSEDRVPESASRVPTLGGFLHQKGDLVHGLSLPLATGWPRGLARTWALGARLGQSYQGTGIRDRSRARAYGRSAPARSTGPAATCAGGRGRSAATYGRPFGYTPIPISGLPPRTGIP